MIQTSETVRYCLVPEFPAYRVGDDGSVWSCHGTGYRPRPWHRMKPMLSHAGYPIVRLSNKLGPKKTYHVHQLVMLAFVGPRPGNLDVRHLNGDPTDNRLANLCYGTRAENFADAVRHGRVDIHRIGMPKLTPEAVQDIRQRAKRGVQVRSLAADHHVTIATVRSVLAGRTWKHLLPLRIAS